MFSDELNINNKDLFTSHENPVTKDEIFYLNEMKKSICKISFIILINGKMNIEKETGFFCELDNCPIKNAIFTNHHFLDAYYLNLGVILEIEYYKESSYIKKQITINEKRRVYTNKELDYTCIEILESDGITDYLKIDPILFTNIKYIKNSDIFILQYSNNNKITYSYGKILSLNNNIIIHNAPTEGGVSGCPIIRRSKENYIIGLSGIKKNKHLYSFNIATRFDSILKDINKPNEITCIYIANDNQNEIKLIHDYNLIVNNWKEETKNLYLETKEINKKIFEENIDLFINGKKVKFDYKYKLQENKEINVKFKFKRNLTIMSFMFYNCYSLKSIDFTYFNTSNITNMNHLFFRC